MVEVSDQNGKVRQTEKICTLFLRWKLMPVDFSSNMYRVQRFQQSIVYVARASSPGRPSFPMNRRHVFMCILWF